MLGRIHGMLNHPKSNGSRWTELKQTELVQIQDSSAYRFGIGREPIEPTQNQITLNQTVRFVLIWGGSWLGASYFIWSVHHHTSLISNGTGSWYNEPWLQLFNSWWGEVLDGRDLSQRYSETNVNRPVLSYLSHNMLVPNLNKSN